MSEPTNSGFPFPGAADDGFDISSIFGGAPSGGAASEVNPFEAALAQQAPPAEPVPQPQPQSVPEPPAPQPAPQPDQPAAPVFQVVQPIQQPAIQKVNPAPAPEAPQPPLDIDPLTAAMAEQETKAEQKAAKSLFEKAPVFHYGSAKEDITDPGMTFEELRIAKADDFPELGEGKRVSWTVEYGKTTKTITDPKGTTIASVKKEIELSKPFLDGLKKAKDKNPDCLVKPRVTAQSKGIASYKGVFDSLEEARASDKAICLIPAGDGQVYELRKTELGEFIAPKDNVTDFAAVRAGFTPALPLVPMELLAQIISFFRCYMDGPEMFEALAHILWDKQEQEFVVHIPPQKVGFAHIDADLSGTDFAGERYLHYIDIHSHNSMAAKFSPVDDADERATRIYIVLGHLEKFFPDISVRMSCGGSYLSIDPGCVLEGLGGVFPAEWRDNVKLAEKRPTPVLTPIVHDKLGTFLEGGDMKFSKTRPVKIVMLGAGGTGGHIAPHLYRLLYSLERPVRFILCDGDVVEGKNLVRQNFTPADLGENKAKVLTERYSTVFGMETEYVPSFVESEVRLRELLTPAWIWQSIPGHRFTERVEELVILIGAVDNNKSRQLCHRVFHQAKELIYIDSGNGEYTGQVVCGVRRNNKTYYPPVGIVYPDVLEETDKFPTELSCAEASVSAPQSMAANITAATAVVDMVYNILATGSSTVRQVTFSTQTVNVRPELQKKKARRSAA